MEQPNVAADKTVNKRSPETRVSELRREKMAVLKPAAGKVPDANRSDSAKPRSEK